MDLFDRPEDNPLTIARALDRLGNISRLRMKKGPTYQTWEHRGAIALRWYAQRGGSRVVSETADSLIRGLNLELEEAVRAYTMISWSFAVYVAGTIGFLVWLIV